MAYRQFIPFAVLLVVLVTALVSGQGKASLSRAEAGPFIGTWLFTMTEPEAFKGSEQTVRVWEKNGVIGASVQIGKFPASDATGIFHDGEMLLLTISHAAQPGIRENGAPIWAVIALTRDGDSMKTAQMLERSQTIKRGVAKKQPD